MFKKISVLVPTRHRLDRLAVLLASYERTTALENSELVFRIDDDDTETIKFLKDHHCVVGPRHAGYASMPTFFNELAMCAEGDVLLCGNDDMIFRTTGWAEKILKVANKYPDGIFDIGVTTLNETHYPFSIVSKKMVEHLGFLWDPRIFWGDIFLRDVAAWFDRCIMLPEVAIDHDWAGYKPDRVFAETRTSKERVEGNVAYGELNALAVREAAEKLQGVVGAPTS